MIRRMLLAAAVLCCLPMGCGRDEAKKELNIYIWAEYLPQDLVDEFAQKTGIKVNVEIYSNNDVLHQKLAEGMSDYDIVVPTDYMVRTLIREKLLQPLDHGRVTNLNNLDKRFMNASFDPGNKHSLPYLWGTTGIGYNKQKIVEPIDSWQALFDERYQGQVLMLNDPRECLAVPLWLMGKPLNTTNPDDLKAAADMLKRQKAQKIVKVYDSDEYDSKLRRGDVTIAHGFNGQLAKLAMQEPDKFAYVVPKEGATRWMDNLCIPSRARNVESAYAFINFVLEPRNSARIVNNVCYAGANAAANEFINPDVLKHPGIYAPDEVLSRCQFMDSIPEIQETIDRLWTEVKNQ